MALLYYGVQNFDYSKHRSVNSLDLSKNVYSPTISGVGPGGTDVNDYTFFNVPTPAGKAIFIGPNTFTDDCSIVFNHDGTLYDKVEGTTFLDRLILPKYQGRTKNFNKYKSSSLIIGGSTSGVSNLAIGVLKASLTINEIDNPLLQNELASTRLVIPEKMEQKIQGSALVFSQCMQLDIIRGWGYSFNRERVTKKIRNNVFTTDYGINSVTSDISIKIIDVEKLEEFEQLLDGREVMLLRAHPLTMLPTDSVDVYKSNMAIDQETTRLVTFRQGSLKVSQEAYGYYSISFTLEELK